MPPKKDGKRKREETKETEQQKKQKSGTVGGATAGPWDKLAVKITDASKGFLEEVKGFSTMAPVQASVIPQMLKGKDVVVEAVTGSGKTLAFLIPIFEMIMTKDDIRDAVKADSKSAVALIIEPTRELAIQVEREAKEYAEHVLSKTELDIRVNTFIGGRDAARDVASYKKQGANVLVGTPGRLYEVLVLGINGIGIKCSDIEVLIMDEADRLLSHGFSIKLDAILQRIPLQRRTGLFSATQTNEVKELIRVGMRNPVMVRVQVKKKDAATSTKKTMQVPDTIDNYYRIIKPSLKLEAFGAFLRKHADKKVIAYFLTCASVDFALRSMKVGMGEELEAAGVQLHPLHGQMPLQRRKKLFKDFRSATGGSVLLCTDVAARGLDVSDIDYVIQLDAPTDPATFVHRIGRTARMGRKGVSMIYLSPSEASYIDYLRLQKVDVQHDDTPDGFETESEDESSDEEDEEEASDEGEEVPVEEKKAETDKSKVLHNPKGAIRFRIKVASHGMREKMNRFRAKRGKGRKEVQQVVVGKPSESQFVYKVRKAVCTDRTLTDIAAKAFVTWVRAYRDHHLRYVFKLGKIDVVDLCHAHGLIKLPKMPELQHVANALLPMEEEFYSVNPKNIKCASEEEEGKRQERLKVKAEKEALKKEEKMSERNRMREQVKDDKTIGKRKKKELWNKMELDELNEDARLLKKLRAGKITEAEYAKASGEDELEFSMLPAKDKAKMRAKKEAERKKREEEEAEMLHEVASSSDEEPMDMDQDSSDDASVASEAEEAPVKIPDGVDKSASGHAPAAWIAMIKRKMGQK